MNFGKTKKGKPTDLKKENKPKECYLGYFLFFCMIGLFSFVFLYGVYEANYVNKHGVWTILDKTNIKLGYRTYILHFVFKLNYQTYEGSVSMTDKELESGDRFFIQVVSGEENRYLVYEGVPDWFNLDAPPQGWQRKPTEDDLKVLMELAKQNRSLEAPNVVPYAEARPSSRQKDSKQKWIDKMKDPPTLLFLGLFAYFGLVFCFYRYYKFRRIGKQGVWTILTIVSRKNGKYGMEVNYKYQLNDQMHTGSGVLSKSQSKTSANRFFLVVMPGETMKKQIENAVPDWFTGEAPPQGWDKLPTEAELREYMNKR